MSYLYCTDLNGSECLRNLLGTFNFVQYKCSSFYGDYVQSLVIAYLSICKDIQAPIGKTCNAESLGRIKHLT